MRFPVTPERAPWGTRKALLEELEREIADKRVLEAIAAVPRDRFVPEPERDHAWLNIPLPIGSQQTISQPLVVARMCELLRLGGDERVLDVGTGSGYHAAVLAQLASHVWTIETRPELAAQARHNLAAAGVENVTCVVGDGSRGHPDAAPYDAINVAAAARGKIPAALEEQLAPEGRLVAPVDGGLQRLVLLERRDGVESENLEGVRFVPLVGEG